MADVSDVIRIQGLAKHYGPKVALGGVTFSVHEGETFGYLGPNGAGKTTTIRSMLGLIRPTSGSITVFGQDVTADLGAILERVGHLPGEFALWPQLTGRDCLDYLGRLHPHRPARQKELCDRFELANADLDRQVRLYSRGMKQKVGIIQAFQHEPALVILDEPTEGLDPLMKERFVELLHDHREAGGTAFLSSHILPEVEQTADRVAVIRAGHLVRVGPTRDLSGERLRHCSLSLKDASDPTAALVAAGATNVSRADDAGQVTWRFDVTGDMEALMRAVGAMTVRELLVEPERLEEAFFDVYGDAAPEAGGAPSSEPPR
jgi:ABC-2 type transport system ATP-binding protein